MQEEIQRSSRMMSKNEKDGSIDHRNRRITLNVSGLIFETWELTLERYPRTLLGNKQKRDEHYDEVSDEYFFHRNRSAFSAILFFYQSEGRLTRPSDVCMDIFEDECCFFELPSSIIANMKSKEGIIIEEKKMEYNMGNLQNTLWLFLQYPNSSFSATIFAAFSLFMVIISIIIVCIETLPSFYETFKQQKYDIPLIMEHVINGWFLLEILIRFAVFPIKVDFFKSALNLIDIIAIIPYFLLQFVKSNISFSRAIQTLRFLRIIRILRLSRNSDRLKLVGRIFMSSFDDMKQLLLCLMIVIIFGGSILYFTEFDHEGTQFTSIPQSLWWAIQTVVVIGYGDIVPQTLSGKIFASSFMVFGALTIALPVLAVVTKFTKIYSKNTNIENEESDS